MNGRKGFISGPASGIRIPSLGLQWSENCRCSRRSEAVAFSSELPSGKTAFWKGSLRWLRLKKLHLTLPHFWPKLA